MKQKFKGGLSGHEWVKDLIPHVLAVIVFLSVAFIYCKPAFDNKILVKEDVTQWKAMAQNSFQYKERHGHFPLWTNGMFSGMPAYQIAMDGTGKHIIRMVFHLTSYYTGLKVQYVAAVMLVLLLAGAVFMEFRGNSNLNDLLKEMFYQLN